MNLKYALLVPLIAFAPAVYAQATPLQDPFTVAVTPVFKFYRYYKLTLRAVRQDLKDIEQKIASLETAAILEPEKPRETGVINEIISQINQQNQKISSCKQEMIDKYPRILKDSRMQEKNIQEKLKISVAHFMGDERPEILQEKAHQLLDRAQDLL